jgi:hypothetical protein
MHARYRRKENSMSKKHIFISLPVVALMLMIGHPTVQADLGPMNPPLPTDSHFPPIEVIDADYGGTGCPEGSAAVVIAGNTLSMLFDEYVAQTYPGYQTSRMSCNFAVALHVPAGYTIALLKIDYRGFADIPAGGRGTFRAEYFWAGSRGPVYTRNFWPNFFGDWIETDFVGGAVWSPCGTDVIARGNTSALARKSSPWSSYEAEIAVDSLDLQAGIVYHFAWDYC